MSRWQAFAVAAFLGLVGCGLCAQANFASFLYKSDTISNQWIGLALFLVGLYFFIRFVRSFLNS